MKLSSKGRYAVMAVVDLCAQGDGAPVSLASIAARQEISHSYLEQLFARLRRAGVVTSVRGPGGGYRLTKPASETRVADVVLAVDEPLDPTRCKGKREGCLTRTGRCLTHDLWDELGRQIYLFLSGLSVADVVTGRVLGRSQGPVHQGFVDTRALSLVDEGVAGAPARAPATAGAPEWE